MTDQIVLFIILVCMIIINVILYNITYKKRDHFESNQNCPKIGFSSGNYTLISNGEVKKTFQNKTDALEALNYLIQSDLTLLSCSLEARYVFHSCDLVYAKLMLETGKYVLHIKPKNGNVITTNYDTKTDALDAWDFITSDNPNIKNCYLDDSSNSITNDTNNSTNPGNSVNPGNNNNDKVGASTSVETGTSVGTNTSTSVGTGANANSSIVPSTSTNTNVGSSSNIIANTNTGASSNAIANNSSDPISSINPDIKNTQVSPSLTESSALLTDQLTAINNRLLRQDMLQKEDGIKLNKLLDLFNKNINSVNEQNAKLKYSTAAQQSQLAGITSLSNQLKPAIPNQNSQQPINDISQAQKMGIAMSGIGASAITEMSPETRYTDEEIKVLGKKLSQSRLKIAENDIMILELLNDLKRANQHLQNNKVIIEEIKKKLHEKNDGISMKLSQSLNKYNRECPKLDPRPLYSQTYPVNVMEIERQGHNSILNAALT